MQECRNEGCTDIGFIDPNIIFNDPKKLKSLKEETEDNIKMFLEMHRNKKSIIFPYIFK